MKINKLYSNVIVPKRATDKSACYDIHAHLRGPVEGEDRLPELRKVKIYNKFNQLEKVDPDLVWDSDDLNVSIKLPAFSRALIPTGIIFDLPSGYSARIHPRSGLAWKHGITLMNCEGVIDSDYCDEIFVILYNATEIPFVISHGDRIAQFEAIQQFKPVGYLYATGATATSQKTNRVGGFGSTGV